MAAHRLTFCAIRRIRERTIGWIILIIVLLLAAVFTAFHVPAFQRNHKKRLAPFLLERFAGPATPSPLFAHANSTLHSREVLCAKQASPTKSRDSALSLYVAIPWRSLSEFSTYRSLPSLFLPHCAKQASLLGCVVSLLPRQRRDGLIAQYLSSLIVAILWRSLTSVE